MFTWGFVYNNRRLVSVDQVWPLIYCNWLKECESTTCFFLARLSRSDKVSFCDRHSSVVCPQFLVNTIKSPFIIRCLPTYSVARYPWELGSLENQPDPSIMVRRLYTISCEHDKVFIYYPMGSVSFENQPDSFMHDGIMAL